MQELQFSTPRNQLQNIRYGILQHTLSLFTPRRLAYSLAGAFLIAGTAAALRSQSAGQQPSNQKAQNLTVQQPQDSPTAAPTAQPADTQSGSTTSSSFSST